MAEVPLAQVKVVEVAAEPVEACPLPAARSLVRCPVCGREDALVAVGEALFCAACGYASDSAAGCT